MVNWSLFPYLIQIQMQGIPKCHEIPHQEIRFWLLLPRLAWMAFVLWRAASWIPQAVPLNILGSGRGGEKGDLDRVEKMEKIGALVLKQTVFLGNWFWCIDKKLLKQIVETNCHFCRYGTLIIHWLFWGAAEHDSISTNHGSTNAMRLRYVDRCWDSFSDSKLTNFCWALRWKRCWQGLVGTMIFCLLDLFYGDKETFSKFRLSCSHFPCILCKVKLCHLMKKNMFHKFSDVGFAWGYLIFNNIWYHFIWYQRILKSWIPNSAVVLI